MTLSLENLQTRRIDPDKPLLEVDDLVMHYKIKIGEVSAVDNVTFTIHQGEAVGLVGESGCGKTSTALSLLRLLPANAEYISGQIRLNGEDLLRLDEEEMRERRWKDIAMVFQGAMNSWNPVYRVGDQIREVLDTHYRGEMDIDEQDRHIASLFSAVGLPPEMADRYPHEFSGGMRQRAVIAMALACSPELIIADEPTTALDVIVQDQILKELKRIQAELGMSILYISHDIAVIAEVGKAAEMLFASLRQRRISRRAMAAILPATIARTHLRQLAGAGFNPDVPRASASATRRATACASSRRSSSSPPAATRRRPSSRTRRA